MNKQSIANNLRNYCLQNIHKQISYNDLMMSLKLFNILQFLQFLFIAFQLGYFRCSIVIRQSM